MTCNIYWNCTGPCNESDTLTISWTHNGQAINTSLFDPNYDMNIDTGNMSPDMSSLTSTGPVNIAHAGVYRCVATSSTGSSMNSTGTVTVTSKYSLCKLIYFSFFQFLLQL